MNDSHSSQRYSSNYEVDGFELQFNFWPHYFHPDEVEEGRQIMTEWVGQVYEAVKGSGSERELAISIPSNVETCLSRGLDPQEWMRRGIVDVLIAQALSRPELRDPNGTSLTYEAPLLEDLRSLGRVRQRNTVPYPRRYRQQCRLRPFGRSVD